MSELSEFISKYEFRCKKCGFSLTPESAIDTALAFGVIVLTGDRDGYIGWSCPACDVRSTILTAVKEEPFLFLKHIHSEISAGIDNTLMYRAFPFSFGASRDNSVVRNGSLLSHAYEVRSQSDFLPDFVPPVGKYMSFKYDSYAMGPAIAIFWYDIPQILDLIKIENKNQVRTIPRYELYDHLNSKISHLCWENRVKYNFYRDEFDTEVKRIKISPEKNIIKKSFDFLTILDTVNSFDVSYHKDESLPHVVFFDERSVYGTDSKTIEYKQYSDFTRKAWSLYHSKWMQHFLNNLSEDFITNYIRIISKTHRSNHHILKLIESYTEKVYESISSEYKREINIKEAKTNFKQRVLEAEKSFHQIKIISNNHIINDLKIQISKTAHLPIADSFLLLGERGTGKDLFAKAIHYASKQKGQFIKVDCGSIFSNLFESEIFGHLKGSFTGADRDRVGALGEANGGTIFFDEIGNLPLNLQPKLLRALQDRKYVQIGSSKEKVIDAKLIFATNKDLSSMVKEGLFTADLFDRFKIPQITIPPLRERKEDIPILIDYFFKIYDTDKADKPSFSLSKECLKLLYSYEWPGNIRDLELVVKDIVIKRVGSEDRSEISESELPDDILKKHKKAFDSNSKVKENLPGNTKITDAELIHWMKEFGNNKSRVAKHLGVVYKTIWERCKKIGL
jgi:transcriptional regulator with PAS, ATPase and Fis domain